MQCREVRDLLDSFLGQELMVETNHELMRHLETCADCRAELEARRQLRAALRRAFTNTGALQPRHDFAAEALARLRQPETKPVAPWRVGTWGAIAASLLAAIGAGVFLLGNRASVVARDAVGDHRNCAITFALAERPISLAEAAVRYDPIYARLQDTPPDPFVTTAGTLRVADRHSCAFSERRFGHVVLQLEGHLLSLLVTDRPFLSSLNPSATRGAPSWLPATDGQRVASFTTPGHVVFVVSDLPDEPFRAVTLALTSALSGRLASLETVLTPTDVTAAAFVLLDPSPRD